MNLAQLCKIRTLPLAKCQNCNACTNVKYIGTFFFSIRNHFHMISNYFFFNTKCAGNFPNCQDSYRDNMLYSARS